MKTLLKRLFDYPKDTPEVAAQRVLIANLESVRTKLVLKIQRTKVDAETLEARRVLANMTGDPRDAMMKAWTDADEATAKQARLKERRKLVTRLETEEKMRPVTHIGHISIVDLPEGTSCGDWQVFVDGKPVPEGAIEAHEDVGYYIYHPVDENKRPIHSGDGHLAIKVVHAPIQLVYSGDNPRYAHFKLKTP